MINRMSYQKTETCSLAARVYMILLVVGFSSGFAYPVQAQISTETHYSNRFNPIPVAIVNVTGKEQIGERIAAVLADNLKRSGYFTILDPQQFPEIPALDAAPNFEIWRDKGVRGLIVGRSYRDDSGRLKTEFRLWDIYAETQLVGQQFYNDPAYWRRIAHIVGDSVYNALTGISGFFDTRIVFIDETGPRNNRSKRLAIMDQDGANIRYLTQGSSIIVTPRYSPVAQEIVFMSQKTGEQPDIQIIDLNTGGRQIVGNFPNMTSSPRFSPDGRKVLMSLQHQGYADIYLLDLTSNQTTRLTNVPAIDTAASFSPDGTRIVFESDRGGSQQLYIMDSDGSNQKRLFTSPPGSYSQPVWSPRGDYIAFTRQRAGKFAIGIIRPDGTDERILAEGFHNESPAWAPNGQYVIFFRDSGGEAGGSLFMVDIFGQVEVRIPTPSSASDPAWSPLLSASQSSR